MLEVFRNTAGMETEVGSREEVLRTIVAASGVLEDSWGRAERAEGLMMEGIACGSEKVVVVVDGVVCVRK